MMEERDYKHMIHVHTDLFNSNSSNSLFFQDSVHNFLQKFPCQNNFIYYNMSAFVERLSLTNT